MTREEIQKLKKVELHCHLDGSLSRRYIERHIGRAVSERELSVSDECRSLNEYLEKFELPLLCLQDERGLEEAAHDVLEGMSKDGICYAEVRFAPLLSTGKGLSTEQVVAAVIRGMDRGKLDFGVDYNLIACAMRHHSMAENARMFHEVSSFLGKGVCAADLAGAEAVYPMIDFMELFRKADSLGFPITIHAGECGDKENIRNAILAGATRIGHGIAMRGDVSLQRMLSDAGVGVEMCPTSNFQTKAVAKGEVYPIREFMDAGLPVSVNTDNRTVSHCTLTDEFCFLQETYHLSDDEIYLLNENAAKTAFLGKAEKEQLLQTIRTTAG